MGERISPRPDPKHAARFGPRTASTGEGALTALHEAAKLLHVFKQKSKVPEGDFRLPASKTHTDRPRLRKCVSCRALRPQEEMVRIVCSHKDYSIGVSFMAAGIRAPESGRSAYLCPSESCIEQALKGSRLKLSLEGRKLKGTSNRRLVSWPLEAQLIQLLTTRCTEPKKTCQNTQRKEGAE